MNRANQAIIAVNSFSVGIMLPVMNLALLERGASLQTLPLLLAAYSATALCLELPSGICADLYGRREVFLLSCVFQFIAYSVMLAADNMVWLVFAMAFHGMGRAFSSGSLDALFIDQAIIQSGEGCLAKVTSRMALLDGIGLAVGGIAGGVLAGMADGYLANISLRMALSAALFIMAVSFVKEQPVPGEKKHTALNGLIRQGKQIIFSTPGFRLLFAGVFFTGVFLSAVETYWQPAFMELPSAKSSLWLLGVITFMGFMAVAAGNIIAQKLLDRYSRSWWNVYNLFRLLVGASIVIFALQGSAAGFVAWYALVYLLLGAGNVAESTLINRLTPGSMRASVLSLSSLTLQIGALCASVFSSIVIMRLKFSGIWITSGVLLGGYALIVAAVTNKIKVKKIDEIDFDG
ncbi:MAG TPA: MFS transporter [Clostridia bacterium]|nr:MFS transporter [Clostridia bacterium]